jgi:FkbM family methyltransferase
MIRSRACTQDQLQTQEYAAWCRMMHDVPRHHRKQWEFVFVADALHRMGALHPGSRGLGFAVGQEPLPSLFASYGCEIVATDLAEEEAQKVGWANSRQHMKTLEQMNARGLCEPAAFQRLVSMRHVDMNAIPRDLRDFDFTWSACSFEHLGSIHHGLEFVRNSLDCLRPGGVAVHTTELNCSSDHDTIAVGGTVLFRRQDFEELARRLRAEGHEIELEFDLGRGPADVYIDAPPYGNAPHLKLALWQFASTSYGLVIRKSLQGTAPSPTAERRFPQAVYGVRDDSAASLNPLWQQAVTLNPRTALALVLGRFKMLIPPMDMDQAPHLFLDGYFDPPVTRAFERLIRPGMKVLDIGARYGYFSLLAADLSGPEGRVEAIETDPASTPYLEQNISLNGLTGRVRVRAADASAALSTTGPVDVIRLDADALPVEQVRQTLRDNPKVCIIVKRSPQQSRDGSVAVSQLVKALPEGFQASVIQADGSWKSASDDQAILHNPLPPDLLLHRAGDLR